MFFLLLIFRCVDSAYYPSTSLPDFLYGYLRNGICIHTRRFWEQLRGVFGFAIAWMTWGTIVHVALAAACSLSIDKLIEDRHAARTSFGLFFSLLALLCRCLQDTYKSHCTA
jgi:hypothetical protein